MAAQSERVYQVRIAAGIVYKNILIASATNSLKTHPFQSKFSPHPDAIYLHAEVNAIKKALYKLNVNELPKTTLYVARIVNGDGYRKFSNDIHKWGLAKPCIGCMRAITTFNIKKVFYTTQETGIYGQL